MIIAAIQYGAGNTLNLPVYDYTGNKPEFYKDDDGNWELVFKKNCQITFRRLRTAIDVFAVGGGNAGTAGDGDAYANWSNYKAFGGAGGNGGGCVTRLSLQLSTDTAYSVSIGESGQSTSIRESGQSTTAFGVTASAGAGATGGYGAISKNWGGTQRRDAQAATSEGSPVRDGVLAFGTGGTLYENGTPIKFGAGGGGGAATSPTGANDSAAGGATGGGAGGGVTSAGSPGDPNTGAGGGGGGANFNTNIGFVGSGGLGGSGIVIIRNARA